MLIALLGLALAANSFVGASRCGGCHQTEFETQRRSHHASALRPILQSPLPEKLLGHTVREKNGLIFDYMRAEQGMRVTVKNGASESTAILEWAFGAGAQGITAVGRIDSAYFEHRVSWYTRENRAALTIGHAAEPPSGAAALGRRESADVIYRCFNCHATGVKSPADLSGLRAGVECERCHGPGGLHAANPSKASIRNPGRLSPRALVEACGECHRLPEANAQPAEPERENPESVRFAPIGLMASRCFQRSGALSCLTCHSPHADARLDAAFYLSKCLSCHAAPSTANSRCRRGAREDCLPCHMPKSSPLPYLTFTDHRIRIIKAAAQESRVEVRLRESRKYDEAGDPARAVAEAQAAIELEPRNLAARLLLGEIFLSHNTPGPAVEIFSDALAIAPDSVLAHLGRGLALRDMQRFDDAENELTYCLTRDPKLGIALDALGGMYLQISQAAKLMTVAKRYIDANPSDHRGYYYLAAAAEHEKRDGVDVQDLLRHALKLNPNFAASHALLGKVLTQQDRLEDGARELERAIQLRPDYAPAHYYLANAYRKLGRAPDATREFQTFRDLNEKQRSQPSLVYHRGQENN